MTGSAVYFHLINNELSSVLIPTSGSTARARLAKKQSRGSAGRALSAERNISQMARRLRPRQRLITGSASLVSLFRRPLLHDPINVTTEETKVLYLHFCFFFLLSRAVTVYKEETGSLMSLGKAM